MNAPYTKESRAVWKSTSELGYSSGHGVDVASMAWGARNLISTQVLHVPQLQPRVADWRGSGRLPAVMRGQPHHLPLREAVLPLCAVDRRKPQQRRHPALKSGSLATIDFSVRSLPRRRAALIVYIILTSLSYERVASIVEVRASGLMLG